MMGRAESWAFGGTQAYQIAPILTKDPVKQPKTASFDSFLLL